jgi:hypothetical protein
MVFWAMIFWAKIFWAMVFWGYGLLGLWSSGARVFWG